MPQLNFQMQEARERRELERLKVENDAKVRVLEIESAERREKLQNESAERREKLQQDFMRGLMEAFAAKTSNR